MNIMNKVKIFAVAGLAAASIAVGGLATAPPASAAISCSQAMKLSDSYRVTGDFFFYYVGSPVLAAYWYGRAESILDGACG
jgi:hypothetical protein